MKLKILLCPALLLMFFAAGFDCHSQATNQLSSTSTNLPPLKPLGSTNQLSSTSSKLQPLKPLDRNQDPLEATNQPPSAIQPLQPLNQMKPLAPLNSAKSGNEKNGEPAKSTSAANSGPPVKISTFVKSEIPYKFINEKGSRITEKYFRIQFKILDPSVNSLDSAVIYLFDQKKELVDTLTDFNFQATFIGTNIKKNLLNYPNMLSTLSGLEKNRIYNLIFRYTHNEIRYKYAIAVIGTKDRLVTDIIPGSSKIQDFNFEGKDKLAK